MFSGSRSRPVIGRAGMRTQLSCPFPSPRGLFRHLAPCFPPRGPTVTLLLCIGGGQYGHRPPARPAGALLGAGAVGEARGARELFHRPVHGPQLQPPGRALPGHREPLEPQELLDQHAGLLELLQGAGRACVGVGPEWVWQSQWGTGARLWGEVAPGPCGHQTFRFAESPLPTPLPTKPILM